MKKASKTHQSSGCWSWSWGTWHTMKSSFLLHTNTFPSDITVPDKDPRAGRLLSFLHQHRQQWQKAPLPLPFLSVLAPLPPSRRHRLLCQAPQKAPQNADLGGIDTLPSPFCRMVHDPEKRSQNPPFPPGNSEILADLGKPSPQTPLYSLCSQTATIQAKLAFVIVPNIAATHKKCQSIYIYIHVPRICRNFQSVDFGWFWSISRFSRRPPENVTS